MTKFEQKNKYLNDTYISLWLWGQVIALIGISNMCVVIYSINSFLEHKDISMFFIPCTIITLTFAYFSVKLKNARHIIFAQLKNNLQKS